MVFYCIFDQVFDCKWCKLTVFSFTEKHSEKSSNAIEEYLIDKTIVENSSYVSRDSIPKSNFFTEVIPSFGRRRFQILARMSYQNFCKVLELIQNDEVFQGKNSEKQFPVYKQLLIVLYRLGSSGEGSTVSKISFLFGIGDGGTLDKITKRVFKAVLRLKDSYLYWPTAEERSLICQETMNELPYCIGYIDGSEVKLAEKPLYDPESYFSRKHIYSLKLQAVCDKNKRIRHLVCGHPGSVHDARIFSNCELATKPDEFFSGSQWLAGDSAYKLTKTIITPYRASSRVGSLQDRNLFNYNFGKYRIRIENTFGIAKERFASLKELRIRIGDEQSLKFANAWIFVCFLLSNIIDKDDFENDFDTMHFNDSESYEIMFSSTDSEAEFKRSAILEFIRQGVH